MQHNKYILLYRKGRESKRESKEESKKVNHKVVLWAFITQYEFSFNTRMR